MPLRPEESSTYHPPNAAESLAMPHNNPHASNRTGSVVAIADRLTTQAPPERLFVRPNQPSSRARRRPTAPPTLSGNQVSGDEHHRRRRHELMAGVRPVDLATNPRNERFRQEIAEARESEEARRRDWLRREAPWMPQPAAAAEPAAATEPATHHVPGFRNPRTIFRWATTVRRPIVPNTPPLIARNAASEPSLFLAGHYYYTEDGEEDDGEVGERAGSVISTTELLEADLAAAKRGWEWGYVGNRNLRDR